MLLTGRFFARRNCPHPASTNRLLRHRAAAPSVSFSHALYTRYYSDKLVLPEGGTFSKFTAASYVDASIKKASNYKSLSIIVHILTPSPFVDRTGQIDARSC
jgi:hypothetical protein